MNISSKYLLLIFCMICSLAIVSNAEARMSGSLEWDYGYFEAEEEAQPDIEANHFAQKYSLFYEKDGQFLNGRGGKYELLIGGEWYSVDTDIETGGITSELSYENSKILYRGDILFAPGGLPFLLHVYSHDQHNSRLEFDSTQLFTEGSFNELTLTPFRRNILDPQIIDDVSDGTYVQSGASMVLGIRNGSYLGRYRNVLSHLPKLYFDYKETHVKDLESITPEHYRDRELAFVSLNKKNNWFHYRFFEHEDKLFPLDDYSETILMVGTVDNNLKREWINLTNWIQVSSDFSFTTEENPQNVIGSENTYLINLFTKTRRMNWQSSSFSNFERWEKVDELVRSAEIPFYSNGSLSRNTSWRFNFIADQEKRNRPFDVINQETVEGDLFSHLRVELNKQDKYILSPYLEVERKTGDLGDGPAFKTGFDYYTNKNFATGTDILYGLDFAYFSGNTEVTNNEIDFYEIIGRMRYKKNLDSRKNIGADANIIFGNGNIEAPFTDYIDPVILAQMRAMDTVSLLISDSATRIDLTFFGELIGLNRIRNRLETGLEYLETDENKLEQYFLLHRLDYSDRGLSVTLENEVIYGDDIKTGISSEAFNVSLGSNAFDGLSVSSQGSIRYTPNREWSFSGEIDLAYLDSDNAQNGGYFYSLGQTSKYSIFSQAGRLRKLFEFDEFLEYELFDLDDGSNFEAVMLTMLGSYFPTSWSKLAAKIRVQNDLVMDFYELGYGVYAGLNFSKLDVGVEYEIGMRTDDDLGLIMDRDEQRWQVNVRKTF